MQIRYAPRHEQRSREMEASSSAIWSQAATAIYETDPDLVAAVLPPPLKPGPEPLVRLTITSVEIPGMPGFGAGWFGVQARHGDRVGEYPLFMPMTTEQSTVGGRETYGEPKKLAEVWAKREGDQIDAGVSRMGFTVCEIRGRIAERREPYEKHKVDFWFKLSPSAEMVGALDQDPLLVYGEKVENARLHEGVDGDLVLKDSPLDPIADLVVRRIVDINWTERTSSQVGRIVATVPRADLGPYLHQRYDDLSVLGNKDD
ncbi:MAG TPA: acetoacetate decarboxylase family protein [Acidimicrobiales bacterium]|nr:acetoacetate decarboxylase family protein [Acidimicrobiales bacterium]